MIYSSPVFIAVRNVTRKLGINSILSRVLAGSGYEDKFGEAMLSEIRAGDCVWDVGANVGLYSTQFAERLSGEGVVVAFEPVPACYTALKEKTKTMMTINPINVAMGASDGEITMVLDSEELAATHRVVSTEKHPTDSDSCTVKVRSATSVAEEHPEWFPNVIKIDVEGFEGAVFDGLSPLLKDQRLRCVGIEVHFGLLEDRGEKNRPKIFDYTFKKLGFDVLWTDPSHIVATR